MHAYRGPGMDTNAGHEAVGTVAALGAGVTGLRVGQRVGASAIAGCGHCFYCAKQQYTWCSNHAFYGNMHAERFLAAARACYPLPSDVAWDEGVLLTGDGLGVPYHTSLKVSLSGVQTVAVFGAGPIGLGNVLLQSHLGRATIAVDLAPERLELARKLGAVATVDASDGDAAGRVRALCDGVGADVCIEASGSQQGVLDCFAAVRTAGVVVFNGEQGEVPLSPSRHFIRRDVTAVGSWFYHFGEIPAMLDLYRRGLDVLSLITHRFPYAEAGEAYALFAARKTGKMLLDWDASSSG
jgi:threonine dehydrogenase-like Zn-dependent dehydrogenase